MITGNEDNTAMLWDAITGEELRILRGYSHKFLSVAFSPDGRRVLTGSYDMTAKVWDKDTGQEIRTFQGHSGEIGRCNGVDGQMLKSTIPTDDLTEWLRPIDAGEMTFIFDSRDSASSVESNNFRPGPMDSPSLGRLTYDKHMRILAASQASQPWGIPQAARRPLT